MPPAGLDLQTVGICAPSQASEGRADEPLVLSDAAFFFCSHLSLFGTRAGRGDNDILGSTDTWLLVLLNCCVPV